MKKNAFLIGAVGVAAVALIALKVKGSGAKQINARCSVRITAESRDELRRLGFLPPPGRHEPNGPSYATVDLAGYRYPDGGIVLALPESDAGAGQLLTIPDMVANCREVDGELKPGKMALAPSDCACSSGTNCTVPSFFGDGGRIPAPQGKTLGPHQWEGTGCVEKPCGPELMGEQGASWPAECPE